MVKAGPRLRAPVPEARVEGAGTGAVGEAVRTADRVGLADDPDGGAARDR